MSEDGAYRFEIAVRESFSFLETELGFVRHELRPSVNSVVVRYETGSLYVLLTYGSPDYEPMMSFGRKGVDDAPGAYSFEAGDLIQLDCCKDWEWQPDQPDRIVRYVGEFARLLAECGRQCLLGDEAVFEEMKARRDALIARSNQQRSAKAVRDKIAAAWERKDYKGVVELYGLIDGQLDELDKRRLHFAISHS